MKQDNNSNLRIILVVAISFLFIVVYSYFQKPSQPLEQPKKEQVAPSANAAPIAPVSKTSDASQNIDTKNTGIFNSNKTIATISSKDVEITIDSLGRISQFYLKDKKFTAPKQEGFIDHIKRLFGFANKPQEIITKLPLLGNDLPKPLEIRFSDVAINNEAFEVPYKASLDSIELTNTPQTITLTQNLNQLVIKKIITFYPNLKYDVKIEVSKAIPYVISSGMRPVADADGYAFHGVLLKSSEDKIEKVEDKKADEKSEQYLGAKFIASVDRYYTSLFFSSSNKGFDAIIGSEVGTKNPVPFVAFDGNAEFEGYIGPKDYKELKNINPNLTDVDRKSVV